MRVIILSALLLLASPLLFAQDGFMRNFSASGLVIDDVFNGEETVVAQIACTIVDAAGSIGIIIFAEANDAETDPLLVLIELSTDLQVANDDWTTLPAEQRDFIVDSLRPPNNSRDSAMVGMVPPGAYCAFAFQNGPEPVGSVNLQITDLSELFPISKAGMELPPLELTDDPALKALLEKARRGLPPTLR